jgi:hypothetical protein
MIADLGVGAKVESIPDTSVLSSDGIPNEGSSCVVLILFRSNGSGFGPPHPSGS